MLYKLYRWISLIADPIIDLYFRHRRNKGKEDTKRFSERLGHPGYPRPEGSLAWVHAASVGEAVSIRPLLETLISNYPKLSIVLTTGTVTSGKLLRDSLPDRIIHQYAPIDKVITVRRFLHHWRPDIALWVESELWPNMIVETQRNGCPMIQVNARMSQDSYQRWVHYRSFIKQMLSCFALSLAQSDDDAKRLDELGSPNVKMLGNLKFDAPALPSDPKLASELIDMISERNIWLAASTHEGEEAIIGNIHKNIKEEKPDILTIIVPRHPERGLEIRDILMDNELRVALRSKDEEITATTDVYIADTLGELGIFYRLASIVFMGGSMVPKGGHNPLEPARLECAIICGPHTDNFRRTYNELAHAGAVIRVKNEESFTEEMQDFLSNIKKQEAVADKAMEFVKNRTGVLDSYVKELEPYFKPFADIIESDTQDDEEANLGDQASSDEKEDDDSQQNAA